MYSHPLPLPPPASPLILPPTQIRAEIKYEAESPDEAALVVAAKALGFFFFKRTNTGITVSRGTASLLGEALQWI